MDYNDGKIYKIIDNTNGNIYIGSTYYKLSERLSKHISNYKAYLDNKSNYITSFNIIENNDYYIELIELYPCSSKDELYAREGYHIRNNECVNKCIIGRTKKEWYDDNIEKIKEQQKGYCEDNKEYIKEYKKCYYENNKEELLEKAKEYGKINRDKLKEYNIEYRKINRDKLKEHHKEYYNNNKNIINNKFICDCGGKYTYSHKNIHLKTKKHKNYILSINSV